VKNKSHSGNKIRHLQQQQRFILLAVSHLSLDSYLLLFFSYPMPQAALHNTTSSSAPYNHKGLRNPSLIFAIKVVSLFDR